MDRRRFLIAGMATVAGLAVAAGPGRAARASSGPAATWFFGQGGLGGVLKAGATAAQVQGAFTVQTTPSQYQDSSGTPVGNIPVFNFVNLAATGTAPPAGFGWGLYSQDTTGQTTDAEILDFANSHTTACANIHGWGLKAFTFPAMDVMFVYDPSKANAVGAPQAFIDDNMIAKACRHADNVGAQSQGQMGDPAGMGSFASHTEAQIDGVPRDMPYFGGLATAKGGTLYTAQNMADAYNATRAYFDGYWINVNGYPQVVADFLNLISG